MRIANNYDLGIPKKEISEGDHHCTEYFETDDNKDLIKKEEDDAEDNGPGTFNTFLGLIPLKCLQLWNMFLFYNDVVQIYFKLFPAI